MCASDSEGYLPNFTGANLLFCIPDPDGRERESKNKYERNTHAAPLEFWRVSEREREREGRNAIAQ